MSRGRHGRATAWVLAIGFTMAGAPRAGAEAPAASAEALPTLREEPPASAEAPRTNAEGPRATAAVAQKPASPAGAATAAERGAAEPRRTPAPPVAFARKFDSEPREAGTLRLGIGFDGPVAPPQVEKLADGRIVIDLLGARSALGRYAQSLAHPLARQVRFGQHDAPTRLRIVVDALPGASFQITREAAQLEILLTPPDARASAGASPAPQETGSERLGAPVAGERSAPAPGDPGNATPSAADKRTAVGAAPTATTPAPHLTPASDRGGRLDGDGRRVSPPEVYATPASDRGGRLDGDGRRVSPPEVYATPARGLLRPGSSAARTPSGGPPMPAASSHGDGEDVPGNSVSSPRSPAPHAPSEGSERAGASVSGGARPPLSPTPATISLHFIDADAVSVVRLVAEAGGFTVRLPPGRMPPLTIALRGVTPRAALERIGHELGWTMRPHRGELVFAPAEPAARRTVEPAPAR